MASISNFYVDAGADYSVTITVEGMDLTGYEIVAQFRRSYGSSTAYSFTGSVTAADDDESQIALVLLGEDSEDIPGGRYLHDVKVISPGGSTKRVVEGIVVVDPQISRVEEP